MASESTAMVTTNSAEGNAFTYDYEVTAEAVEEKELANGTSDEPWTDETRSKFEKRQLEKQMVVKFQTGYYFVPSEHIKSRPKISNKKFTPAKKAGKGSESAQEQDDCECGVGGPFTEETLAAVVHDAKSPSAWQNYVDSERLAQITAVPIDWDGEDLDSELAQAQVHVFTTFQLEGNGYEKMILRAVPKEAIKPKSGTGVFETKLALKIDQIIKIGEEAARLEFNQIAQQIRKENNIDEEDDIPDELTPELNPRYNYTEEFVKQLIEICQHELINNKTNPKTDLTEIMKKHKIKTFDLSPLSESYSLGRMARMAVYFTKAPTLSLDPKKLGWRPVDKTHPFFKNFASLAIKKAKPASAATTAGGKKATKRENEESAILGANKIQRLFATPGNKLHPSAYQEVRIVYDLPPDAIVDTSQLAKCGSIQISIPWQSAAARAAFMATMPWNTPGAAHSSEANES